MEVQLRASEEDGDRLRKEREQLRERLLELQSSLREKEAEVSVHPAGWVPFSRGIRFSPPLPAFSVCHL